MLDIAKQIKADRDYDLWKYFSYRADHIKDRLWSAGTWLIAIAAGLLAFVLDRSPDVISLPPSVTDRNLTVVLSLLGLGLLGYTVRIVADHDRHIQRNWARANEILGKDATARQGIQTPPGRTLVTVIAVLSVAFPWIAIAAIMAP